MYSGANASVTNLTSPNGTIAKSAITLYRENFVTINPSSEDFGGGGNTPGPAGKYADGLIPFADPASGNVITSAGLLAAPFAGSSGVNQVLWVDVAVPATASSGTYHGTLTVTTSAGNVDVPIMLTVWNFTLPQNPSESSSFVFWNSNSLANEQELLKNKLMPTSILVPGDESALNANFGLTMTNTGPWSGVNNTCGAAAATPSIASLQALAASHNSQLLLYDYSFDEITNCSSLFPAVRQWGYNMHHAGIKNLVTMAPNPALFDDGSGTNHSAVDIWVELPLSYDSAKVAAAQNKGDQVWSYNTLTQDNYSPKWQIDYAPINTRIQAGFINHALGMTGLLYWQIDLWSITSLPSYDPWTNPNTTGYFTAGNYAGEGLLLYPGAPVGASCDVPSMRLKQLRDGVEDYEYMEILHRLGQDAFTLAIQRPVATDWHTWSQDPLVLLNARYLLGQKIDSLIGSVNAGPPPTASSSLNVSVYPNPWRTDRHAGLGITFDRLSAGTTIKLFTVSAREVKELHTNGPTATWDLTNDAGDKVASGIYIYLVTDAQHDKVRGKLSIIR